MQIPSSINIARKLINDNPTFFNTTNAYDKLFISHKIANAMQEYYDQCKAYVNQDQPKINEIKEHLSQLNNLIK